MLSLKKFQRIFTNVLANLQFAIFLLVLIAFYSVCGSILEQDQPVNYYIENYSNIKVLNFFSFSDLILKFELDRIFSTVWFYALIFVFSLSLITCSFTRQLPTFLFFKGNRFFYSQNIPKTLQICKTFNYIKISSLNNSLLRQKFLIFQKRNSFYSYKGLIGKFAPLLVHLSLIITILGSVIATLSSFSAQELVSKSEIATIQNITRRNLLSNIPSYSLKINDFWIDYNSTNNINQYFSDISILDDAGNESIRRTISVNHPLQYEGLTIYQTDWTLNTLRLKLKSGQIQQVPLSILKDQKKSWVGNVVIDQNQYFFVLQEFNGLISIYDSKGQFYQSAELGQKLDDFQIIDVIPATGLQLKEDPGIPILYLGFFFLMISIILNNQYFPEIWISTLEENNKVALIGKTNRSVIGFNIEIFKTLKQLVF